MEVSVNKLNVAANDGTSFDQFIQKCNIWFSNKTDSGLSIGMVTELQSDDGDAIDESLIIYRWWFR